MKFWKLYQFHVSKTNVKWLRKLRIMLTTHKVVIILCLKTCIFHFVNFRLSPMFVKNYLTLTSTLSFFKSSCFLPLLTSTFSLWDSLCSVYQCSDHLLKLFSGLSYLMFLSATLRIRAQESISQCFAFCTTTKKAV